MGKRTVNNLKSGNCTIVDRIFERPLCRAKLDYTSMTIVCPHSVMSPSAANSTRSNYYVRRRASAAPQAPRGKPSIYYIIRCSRMWRHSHCPSPRSFFLFRHFDSENCNLTDVNTNIKTSPNLPYLFITSYFGIYRSREGVMGAFPHPTFSCARPLFPFVSSLKSFVLPLLSHDS